MRFFNNFLKDKNCNILGRKNPLEMCAGLKRFFGPRTWILSSMTPFNVWNYRPFNAVINTFFNSFSDKNCKFTKGNTLLTCPQFSSVFMDSALGYGAKWPVQASEITVISMLSSMRFSILLRNRISLKRKNTLPNCLQFSSIPLNCALGFRLNNPS